MAGITVTDRLRKSWNVLRGRDEIDIEGYHRLITTVRNQYTLAWRDSSERILAPIRTRIALDVANTPVRHARLNEDGQFVEFINSELDKRFTLQANIDQSGFAFMLDVAQTIMNEGVAALVPVDVTTNPTRTVAYDILTLRVGVITDWYTQHVGISLYNEQSGEREPIILPKSYVAVVQNPLYAIMNDETSTVKRLIDKLALLDVADKNISKPNLDLILQLPYSTRNTKMQEEAASRLANLEEQLTNSAYGVAYIDSVEKITQLNRPVVNSLGEQVADLKNSLYTELGLTPAVFDGTASESQMLLYFDRTVLPMLKAITGSIKMTFLSKTAIAQKQSIVAIPDLFKMAPINEIAEAADKFTRNEILSSNEVRSAMGLRRVDDPKADKLINKNLNQPDDIDPPEVEVKESQ